MADEKKQKSDNRPARRTRRDPRGSTEEKEFDQRIIDLARVTRVMAGGKRMRFRACVVVGDRKGRLGYGLGKGADVTIAVQKAANRARRDVITVPIVHETIPHELHIKEKAARLLLKPAPKGTGVVAGGAIRLALELSGIGNIAVKVYGSKNKINNIRALFSALTKLSESLEKRALLLRPYTPPQKKTEETAPI